MNGENEIVLYRQWFVIYRCPLRLVWLYILIVILISFSCPNHHLYHHYSVLIISLIITIVFWLSLLWSLYCSDYLPYNYSIVMIISLIITIVLIISRMITLIVLIISLFSRFTFLSGIEIDIWWKSVSLFFIKTSCFVVFESWLDISLKL